MKIRLKLGVLYNGTLHHDVLVKILTVVVNAKRWKLSVTLG